MSQAWGERSRLPNAGIDIDSDTHPHAHRSLDRNAYPDAYANSGTGSDTHADGDLCVTHLSRRRASSPSRGKIEMGVNRVWTPVCRDLCVTSAAARLNVILSAAKNPKGFIPRQRSFASKGFGFFTSLRSVQNDSETRIC